MCIRTSEAAGPRGYKGKQDLIVVVPAVGTPLMAAVGRAPRFPLPAPIHRRLPPVHTMLMPTPQMCPYGVASWAGERRFMIRCVASDSTLMSHPVGQIRHRPTTTANTA